MDDNLETSRIALKIVLFLSAILVTMDFVEVYFAYLNLRKAMVLFDQITFEECLKYHILSQIFFTLFATFSGISAFLMSLGLLVNFDAFIHKALDTFMYMNYMIFGPFLLGASLLGYFYFEEVVYNCDKLDYNRKFLNLSTLFALCICFLVSLIITVGYSVLYSLHYLLLSINNRSEGSAWLRKLFWWSVFTRRNQMLNNQIVPLNHINNNNINSNI
jgi:hypothetical protein